MTLATWTPAYIGVGSNLDNPQVQVASGIDALSALPSTQVIARSRLYLSAPLGPQDQPEYVNAAVGLLTQLDAPSLLSQLKLLEQSLGRGKPIVRWGPRVIDFDLLVFGTARIDSELLTVPHPGLAARAFVVVPLRDVAPELEVPGIGRVSALANRIDASALRVL
jgi:2-amino-4-hydroxy-6-hydroxymethyldihydropteridine diphosphokinase